MGLTVGDLKILITGNSSGLSKELDKSKGDVRSFTGEVQNSAKQIGALGSVVQGVFQGIGQAILRYAVDGLRAFVGEVGKSVNAASNLTESINKAGVAFGDSAKEIVDWSKTSDTALGQSQQQALEAASSFGLLFRTMGLGNKDAADMSKRLVELASDLASINNIPVDEALQKIRSGLVGEAEPLRSVGVLLNETAVQQKALALGLATSTDSISEQDKVLARYNLILDQTKLAQGDFAKTSGELANAQRILQAQIEDSETAFGQAILPIKLAVVKGLSDLIEQVKPYGPGIINALAQGLADGITSLLPFMAQLRSFFTYWMQPHSPPKFLPDLAEWGKGALRAYLKGWTEGDFSALKTVGGSIDSILRSFAGTGQIEQTDLVGRVFGTGRALVDAINEWRTAGAVSVGTLSAIRNAAGPAGDAVSDLVDSYFNLQQAAQGATQAQQELDAVTRKYDALLSPLQEKLDGIQDKEQKIRDDQRLKQLGDVINDKSADVSDRRLARLEQEEILAKRKIDAVKDERDVALDAEQKKLDAANEKQKAAKDAFDLAQSVIDQQVKANGLIQEENDLRTKLANEALAAQTKAQHELEQAQNDADAEAKKHQTELDRIYDAQLRYKLATTDTAGQLAILQGELAKTTKGSADYYDILTQIAGLEDKLQSERDKAGDGGTVLDQAGKAIDGLQTKLPGIDALSKALGGVVDMLGGKTAPAELNPFWKNLADTIKTTLADASEAIGHATPIVMDFIALFTGESKDVPTADILRPTENNGTGIFSSIVGGMRWLLSTLTLIKDHDWPALWDGFKANITGLLNSIDPNADPTTFGFYSFLVKNLIPAIDALRVGDWRRAWKDMGGEAVEAFAVGILTSKSSELMMQLGLDLISRDGIGFLVDLYRAFVGTGGSSKSPAQKAPPLGEFNWTEIFKSVIEEALRESLQSVLPSLGIPIQPQSYTPPSAAPGVAIASLAGFSGGGSSSTTHNALGPFNLIFNVPVTAEVARSAASNVDQELRRRGWAPT